MKILSIQHADPINSTESTCKFNERTVKTPRIQLTVSLETPRIQLTVSLDSTEGTWKILWVQPKAHG